MQHPVMAELGRSLLISSGAMGTCLRRTAPAGEEPVELLNIRQPDAVRGLHEAYRAAGSRILLTNTFAANAVAFGDAGLAERCDEANRAGVTLARAAAGEACAVWASVGPLGLGLRLDDYTPDALLAVYRRQCDVLKDADALLLETFADRREARAALQAATGTGRPVVFQIGHPGGGPDRWSRAEELLREALRAGVAAVGANCHHPDEIERLVSLLGDATDLPLTASPNAGHPRIERGLVEYEFPPGRFAASAAALAARGVAVVGGCCGTTPDHIREMSARLAGRSVVPRRRIRVASPRAESVRAEPEAAANPVRARMASARCLVSVEIRADRNLPLSEIVRGAAGVAAAGADFFDVPDNPGATVGRDAMVTAARLQGSLGVPAICHMGVTQSNLMRLHSTLIGCWDAGLRGILAVTGDAPSMGHLGGLAHRVADVRSSVELLRLIRGLRDGRIVNGEAVADPPDLCAGCAFGQPVPAQVRWLREKIDVGAEFAFSQPVFAFEDYARLRDTVEGLPIRMFPGLLPLVSRRGAAFLAAGRIPGIAVPPDVVSAFDRYESSEDQRRFGMDRAEDLAAAVAESAAGLYLIMPFGRSAYEDAARIVRRVKGTASPMPPMPSPTPAYGE